MLRSVRAIRYVMPFREGGSVPALVEADDLGLYVVKLRGAGQGARALVAELVAGELARAVGRAIPEIVLVTVDRERAGPGALYAPRSQRRGQPRPRLSSGEHCFRPRGRSPARPGRRVAHRPLRCLRGECRSHGAQYEPALVAWPALAHRPRSLAVLPPWLGCRDSARRQ